MLEPPPLVSPRLRRSSQILFPEDLPPVQTHARPLTHRVIDSHWQRTSSFEDWQESNQSFRAIVQTPGRIEREHTALYEEKPPWENDSSLLPRNRLDESVETICKWRSSWYHPHKKQVSWSRPKTDDGALEGVVLLTQRSGFARLDILQDHWPLLDVRKSILRVALGFRQACEKISENYYFQTFIILCILLNTVLLALEDPSLTVQPEPYQSMELTLLYIYTAEMVIKIIPQGFLISRKAYIRDNWNKMDCLVVTTGWLELYNGSGSVNMSALRALRILRPLRSITRIQGMKIIFLSLIRSVKALASSLALLLFFYLITSIAALQMFMGVLKNRCMDLDTGDLGSPYDNDRICGNRQCAETQVCVKSLDNINYGKTNFDNVFMSLLTIFQSVTLEGWSDVRIGLEKTFSDLALIFYIPVVFLGAFFFNNMLLIAMKSAVLFT